MDATFLNRSKPPTFSLKSMKNRIKNAACGLAFRLAMGALDVLEPFARLLDSAMEIALLSVVAAWFIRPLQGAFHAFDPPNNASFVQLFCFFFGITLALRAVYLGVRGNESSRE